MRERAWDDGFQKKTKRGEGKRHVESLKLETIKRLRRASRQPR